MLPVWINSWTGKINRGKLLPILAANAGQKNNYCIYVFFIYIYIYIYVCVCVCDVHYTGKKNYVNHIWSEQYLTYVSLHRQCNLYQPIPSATSQPHSATFRHPSFFICRVYYGEWELSCHKCWIPLQQHRFCAKGLSTSTGHAESCYISREPTQFPKLVCLLGVLGIPLVWPSNWIKLEHIPMHYTSHVARELVQCRWSWSSFSYF